MVDFSGIGDALATGAQGLQEKWRSWLADPANRAALIQSGVALMQPVSIGQSPFGHLGQAIGAGAEASARYGDQVRKDEEFAAQQEDRKFKRGVASEELGLEKRKVGVMEQNAASLQEYRKNAPRGLTSLFARNDDQLTAKLWAAAKAEADNHNNSLDAFNDDFVPRTPQDFLGDPAWISKTTQVLNALPGMPGTSNATGLPTPAQPTAQPIPQPSAPTKQWKIGDVEVTPQGTFKLVMEGGKYTWQKVK